MKKKLLILLSVGLLLTGCSGKEGGESEKTPEIVSLDISEGKSNGELEGEQENTANSESEGEIVIGETDKQSQEQAQEPSTDDSAGSAQSENSQDLYMQFMDNEVSAVIGNAYPQSDHKVFGLESGGSYTFSELGQYVNQSYFDPEYSEKTSYDHVQYAYVDCPDSDSRNFLIKFVGLNIYSPDDDSFAVYVLTEDNGQLYLTDGYECWARSYTEQYRSGLCSSGGSSGAGDHYVGISAILSDGKITDIYGAEILTGWWTSYVNGALYSEVFGESMEAPLNVSIYTIGESEYYTYDWSECTDEQAAVCETYINRCRDEAGIDWSTEEKILEAIKERCSLIGVDYDSIEQQEEVEWTDFDDLFHL